MRILKAVKQHVLSNVWEQYAKEYLVKHPDCFGKSHNKIKNYYIYKEGTKSRSIKTEWANSTRSYSHTSMAGLVTSYEIFRKVIEDWFKRAVAAIIGGELIQITHVGKFCMVRVERDFRKKSQLRVDWGRTKKQDKIWSEEKQKMVYPKLIMHTDDDWCRVRWYKPGVTNDTVYEFVPTEASSGGKGGFLGKLTEALKFNPQLKFLYLFNPIRDKEDYPVRKTFKQQVAS